MVCARRGGHLAGDHLHERLMPASGGLAGGLVTGMAADLGFCVGSWRFCERPTHRQFAQGGPADGAARCEVLVFAAFPKARWQKIWSTNPSSASTKR